MNEQTKPRYFRLLEKGEIIKEGDRWIKSGGDTMVLTSSIGDKYTIDVPLFRPIQVDEWIEYAERKPRKEDFPLNTITLNGRIGFARQSDSTGNPVPLTTTESDITHDEDKKITHWRIITPPEQPKPKSVTVSLRNLIGSDRRRLSVNSDGTVTVVCGEILSAESIDEFIKARAEVMRKND